MYRVPTAGSRKITDPHPYGWSPCLWGSTTTLSDLLMARKARFVELGGKPEFQARFADAMMFE